MSELTQTQLTIIIPFHHESSVIAPVLSAIQTHTATIQHEVLLVHDDQADPTVNILKDIQKSYPQMNIFLNQFAPGVPGAIRTGLTNAKGKYLLFLVADDPSPAEHIKAMLTLLEQGHDLVSLSRYTKGGHARGGLAFSRFLSYCANRLFFFLSGSKLTDMTCGFKMFRKTILDKMTLRSNADWTLPFELAILAQVNGLPVAEIPFVSCDRIQGGQSHFRTLPRIIHYGKIFIWGIALLREKRTTCPTTR